MNMGLIHAGNNERGVVLLTLRESLVPFDWLICFRAPRTFDLIGAKNKAGRGTGGNGLSPRFSIETIPDRVCLAEAVSE